MPRGVVRAALDPGRLAVRDHGGPLGGPERGAVRAAARRRRAAAVAEQLDESVARREPRFPVAAAMLAEARADLTAFAAFPVGYWRKIWSTNPLSVNRSWRQATARAA